MLSTLPSLTRLMPGAINAETLPLGPSTSTVLPSTVYFTPAGNGIGFLPIRDIAYSLCGLRVLSKPALPNSTAAQSAFALLHPRPLIPTTDHWPPVTVASPHFAQNFA